MKPTEVDLEKQLDALRAPRTEKYLAGLPFKDQEKYLANQLWAINAIYADAVRKASTHAIYAGRALRVIKRGLGQKDFEVYLTARKPPLARSTAYLYMQAAENEPKLRARGIDVDNLSLRALRGLLTERPQQLPVVKRGQPLNRSKAERERASVSAQTSDQISRVKILVDHLLVHGDAITNDAELLPLLEGAVAELKKRRTRRRAVETEGKEVG